MMSRQQPNIWWFDKERNRWLNDGAANTRRAATGSVPDNPALGNRSQEASTNTRKPMRKTSQYIHTRTRTHAYNISTARDAYTYDHRHHTACTHTLTQQRAQENKQAPIHACLHIHTRTRIARDTGAARRGCGSTIRDIHTAVDGDRGRQAEQAEGALMRIQSSEHPRNVGAGKEQSEACRHSAGQGAVRAGSMGGRLPSEAKRRRACSPGGCADKQSGDGVGRGEEGHAMDCEMVARERQRAGVRRGGNGCVWAGVLSRHYQDSARTPNQRYACTDQHSLRVIRYKKAASIGSNLPSEAKHKKACAVHQNTDIDRDRGRQTEQTENTLMRIQNSEHPQNVGAGKEQSEACKNSTEHSTVRTGNIGRKLFSGKNHKKSCSVRKHTGIHHQ